MECNTLFIRNFSGYFNEVGIGHEVINMFDTNNKLDYIPFYVPPYGMVFSEKKDRFLRDSRYKKINTLVIFDTTSITNVFKLKAISTNIGYYNNYQEIEQDAEKFTYGPNNIKLKDIKFGDDEYRTNNTDIEFVSRIKYKVYKNHYYNFENDNILIWCSSNKKRDNLKQKSIDKCEQIYGIKPIDLKDTTIGQKNYIYNTLGKDFKVFIQNKIKSICNDDHIYRLSSLSNLNRNIQTYVSNSLFEHLQKASDENLITNFIYYVLNLNNNLNNKLKDKFMSYLASKAFNVSDYIPSNVELNKQYAIKVNNGSSNKGINGILDMYINKRIYKIKF